MALSSPSPEIEQLPTSPGCLCQGRFIVSLDDIGASWNTGGAALLREARRASLRFSTGRSSSRGHRRAPTATSKLGLALRRSGASRRCWAQSSTVSPNSPAWETRASRKLTLSTSLLSARLSHRRRSWTTSVDIAFPRDCAVTSLTHRAMIGNDRNQEDTAGTASLKRREPTVIFALLRNLLF